VLCLPFPTPASTSTAPARLTAPRLRRPSQAGCGRGELERSGRCHTGVPAAPATLASLPASTATPPQAGCVRGHSARLNPGHLGAGECSSDPCKLGCANVYCSGTSHAAPTEPREEWRQTSSSSASLICTARYPHLLPSIALTLSLFSYVQTFASCSTMSL